MRESLRDPLRLLLAALSLAGLGAAQLALPWVIKGWVEGPLANGVAAGTGRFALTAAAIAAAVAVLLLTSRTLLASVNQRLVERLRNAAVGRVLAAEPGTVRTFPSGDVLSRVMQDAGMLSGFVDALLKRVVGDGVLVVGAITMMFVLQPTLALATCVLAPLIALLLVALGAVIRRLGTAAQRAMGGLAATLEEQLHGFTTIKGYQAEAVEKARFIARSREYRRHSVLAEAWSALLVSAVFLLAAGGFILAVRFGSAQVAAGGLTAGGLLAFCLYAGQTVEPLRRLADMHALIQRSLAAAERLLELIELSVPRPMPVTQVEPAFAPPAASSLPERGGLSLHLDGVRFRYRPELPLLEGVSLDVRAGERVAIVAASAGGKSTLAALLLRFLEPESGRILLDGRDIADLDLTWLRRRVCVVEQEPFLFAGPLLDNIRYGSPGAAVTAVSAAASLVGLDPLVASRPDGLLAAGAERGRDVSGGQRQRVALARALVRDAPLVVLDEATSALDGEAEARLFADLEEWLARRTLLVMAHRLSTVRRLPRIIVLEQGRVVDEGTFEGLVEASPSFRALFAEQLEACGLRAR